MALILGTRVETKVTYYRKDSPSLSKIHCYLSKSWKMTLKNFRDDPLSNITYRGLPLASAVARNTLLILCLSVVPYGWRKSLYYTKQAGKQFVYGSILSNLKSGS